MKKKTQTKTDTAQKEFERISPDKKEAMQLKKEAEHSTGQEGLEVQKSIEKKKKST
jgi:hypothetical protein